MMDKEPIKFDTKTKMLVDNLNRTIHQAEVQLLLLCRVYLRKDQLFRQSQGVIAVPVERPGP